MTPAAAARPDASVRNVLLPKDWLGFSLTDVAAAGASDALGSGVIDVRAHGWGEAILACRPRART